MLERKENVDRSRANPYNKLPIHFCEECLSIKIVDGGEFLGEYCGVCGSQNVRVETMDTYDSLYRRRYGIKYFNLIK